MGGTCRQSPGLPPRPGRPASIRAGLVRLLSSCSCWSLSSAQLPVPRNSSATACPWPCWTRPGRWGGIRVRIAPQAPLSVSIPGSTAPICEEARRWNAVVRVSRAATSPLIQPMQFPPHDLACAGLGHVGHELDFSRAFVCRQFFAAEGDHFLFVAGFAFLQNDIGLGDLAL